MLRFAIIPSISASLLSAADDSAHDPSRPNIVWIMTEDTGDKGLVPLRASN